MNEEWFEPLQDCLYELLVAGVARLSDAHQQRLAHLAEQSHLFGAKQMHQALTELLAAQHAKQRARCARHALLLLQGYQKSMIEIDIERSNEIDVEVG